MQTEFVVCGREALTSPERDGRLQAVIDVLGALARDNHLFVSLSPPFSVGFDADRPMLDAALAARGQTEEDFDSLVGRVEQMLLASLEGREDEFVAQVADEDATEGELRSLVTQVRLALWSQHLQSRYDLKKSSKAPSFSAIDWDVKIKTRDAHLDEMEPFPYATIRLTYQRDFASTPFAILGRPFESVQINLSIDEVVYLLRVLTGIRDILGSEEDRVRAW